MGKKKKAKKRSQSSLALTPDEISLVTSLIEDMDQLSPEALIIKLNSTKIASAFVERLPLEKGRALHLAQAIALAFQDKLVHKTVRKFFFKLKAKGIDIPELETKDKARAVLSPPKMEEPRAYIGNYDPFWVKPLILALPRVPRGFDVVISAIEEGQGLIDFNWTFFSKKALKDLEQNLKDEDYFQMVATSVEHVFWLLENAYKENRDKGSPACKQYVKFKEYTGAKVTPLKRHPIYELIDETAIRKEGLVRARLENLFQDTLFMAPFFIKPEEIRPLVRQLQELDDSLIIMPNSEAEAREEKIILDWLSEKYPPQERQRLKHRLEETAYVLFKIGKEEEAKIALMCAADVLNNISLFEKNLFLEYLLELSLDIYEGSEEFTQEEKGVDGAEQDSPIIIKP